MRRSKEEKQQELQEEQEDWGSKVLF